MAAVDLRSLSLIGAMRHIGRRLLPQSCKFTLSVTWGCLPALVATLGGFTNSVCTIPQSVWYHNASKHVTACNQPGKAAWRVGLKVYVYWSMVSRSFRSVYSPYSANGLFSVYIYFLTANSPWPINTFSNLQFGWRLLVKDLALNLHIRFNFFGKFSHKHLLFSPNTFKYFLSAILRTPRERIKSAQIEIFTFQQRIRSNILALQELFLFLVIKKNLSSVKENG